jgi:hypothetical protein
MKVSKVSRTHAVTTRFLCSGATLVRRGLTGRRWLLADLGAISSCIAAVMPCSFLDDAFVDVAVQTLQIASLNTCLTELTT